MPMEEAPRSFFNLIQVGRPAILLSLVLSAVAPAARAEEPPLRAFFLGNSLTDQLRYPLFEQLSAAGGHRLEWQNRMRPGVPVSFWWKERASLNAVLTQERWDVITLQPFQNFEIEFEGAENFARFFLEHQPEVQLYIYAQWRARQSADWRADFIRTSEVMPTTGWDHACRERTGESFWLENVARESREAGLPAVVERSLKNQYELTVLGLRARVPMKKPVKLIPVGHVIELLESKMRAGQVPGYTSPFQFYTDNVHLDNVGCYIVACTFYATIHQASPVGLPVGGYGDRETFPYPGKVSPISDELARVIQETVWEVVATHPLTGVTSVDPLKVATASLPPAVQGEPYEYQLLPAFGCAPYHWTMSAGTLPEGLTLHATGLLSGTPSAPPGDTDLVFDVTDAGGGRSTRPLRLVIEADTAPVVTTPLELPPRKLGEYFTLQLEAEGGNGALRWELAERHASLPPGLELNPDGTLSGSPGQEGTHVFTLKVTDSDFSSPDSVTARFSLTVGPPGGGVFRVRSLPQGTQVKVDGVLDEPFWDLKEPIRKLVMGDESHIQAWFDIVRVGTQLYVAVKVIDSTPHVSKTNELWDGDSVELFLDVLNNREEVYNFDDRRIVVADKPRGHLFLVAPQLFGHDARVARTDDGYTVEFGLNFWSLGFRTRNYPAVMGLDIAVNDDRDGTGRSSQVVWQGTEDNDTVPRFGTIILEKETEKL